MGGFFWLMFIEAVVPAIAYALILIAGLVTIGNFGLVWLALFVIIGFAFHYAYPVFSLRIEQSFIRILNEWHYADNRKRWLTRVLLGCGCLLAGIAIVWSGLPDILDMKKTATWSATRCAMGALFVFTAAAILIGCRNPKRFGVIEEP